MIAGTPFVLCDAHTELQALRERAQRSQMGDAGLRRLLDQVDAGCTLAVRCDEGLLLITLRCDGQETIAVIELAVSERGKGAAFKPHEADVMALARDAGASRLVFDSHRRGWARLLGPQWVRQNDVFIRSV